MKQHPLKKDPDPTGACVVCGDATEFCCSDCAIDFGGQTYVCVKRACLDTHTAADAPRLTAHNAEARRLRTHGRLPSRPTMTQLREQPGEFIRDVDREGRSFTITKAGKPVARLVPVEGDEFDWAALQRLRKVSR